MNVPPIRTVVVDDDYRVAAIHAAYVEKVEGFTVVGQAHTASEATKLVGDVNPDLVVMDVFLPDGNGLTVIRDILERDLPPAAIVITAARDMATIRMAMQLGAVYYLVKPFGFAALSERLRAYQRLHLRIEGLRNEADQADVDELFGMLRNPIESSQRPPKGQSAPTLALVRDAVRAASDGISASDVATATGISRATAQRYLGYLEGYGVVRLQLRYGAVGRPEHRYVQVSHQ